MPSSEMNLILGLGLSGLSCARYLAEQGIPFAVNDTRLHPEHLDIFKKNFPNVPISLGKLDVELIKKATELIVSPGISLREPPIAESIARGVSVYGDIELFARKVKKPVIAITGTNAKSTVTSLVFSMVEQSGIKTAIGGNFGTPVLDLIKDTAIQVFVLELSSFQLETTFSLQPKVAAILNITPDHLDRHLTMENYIQAKQKIYHRCNVRVFNRDDSLTHCDNSFKSKQFSFTLSAPNDASEFGLITQNNEVFLAHGDECLLSVNRLPILGRQFQANALAALAIGYGFGLPLTAMLQTLETFKGLPHRCQEVGRWNDIGWYNDSKGTNVGATLAALEGIGSQTRGRLILIAGGLSKNADFSPLIPAVKKYVKKMILIGQDAQILANVFKDFIPIEFADSMQNAVQLADKSALAHDNILLSPACASWDMFKNFAHRGEVFMDLVFQLKKPQA